MKSENIHKVQTLTRSGNLNRGKLKPCTTVSCLRYCSGLKPNVTSNGFMRVVFRSNKDKRVQVVIVKVKVALVVVCGLVLISKVQEGRLSFQQAQKSAGCQRNRDTSSI